MANEMDRIIRALGRLNDLQSKRPRAWVRGLTETERELAIEHARTGIPHSMLIHHDELVSGGRRSLGVVDHGTCGACGRKLRAHHHDPGEQWGFLDVCDSCGVFLVWPPTESGPRGKGGAGR